MHGETDALLRTTYTGVFGRVIRAKRDKKQWDQASIAQKLGIKQPNYSRIESGDVAASVEMLAKLATVFDETPSTLLQETDQAVEALRSKGIEVLDERPPKTGDLALALLGGAALAAMIVLALRSR